MLTAAPAVRTCACGTVLSRYNEGTRCAPCREAREARPTARPRPVPPVRPVRPPYQPRRREALSRPLTRRERDVLALLVEGLTNPEIAAALVIGRETVNDHVDRLLRSLGATNRTHAAVLAVRKGLVP